jgi:hypothetical protein
MRNAIGDFRPLHQCREDVGGVGFGVDGFVDLGDRTGFDHVGDPLGVFDFIPFGDDIVRRCDFTVDVCQEWEGQIIFRGEGLVGDFVVEADAEDGDAFGEVLFVVIAEAARFFGATGGVVFGVEVEDDAFSGEVGEFDGVAVGVFDGEVRGDRASRECHRKNLEF